jgi:hypothetical protein
VYATSYLQRTQVSTTTSTRRCITISKHSSSCLLCLHTTGITTYFIGVSFKQQRSCSISPDVAVCSGYVVLLTNDHAAVYTLMTCICMRFLTVYRHHVLCTAWSPDGKRFASADRKGAYTIHYEGVNHACNFMHTLYTASMHMYSFTSAVYCCSI